MHTANAKAEWVGLYAVWTSIQDRWQWVTRWTMPFPYCPPRINKHMQGCHAPTNTRQTSGLVQTPATGIGPELNTYGEIFIQFSQLHMSTAPRLTLALFCWLRFGEWNPTEWI